DLDAHQAALGEARLRRVGGHREVDGAVLRRRLGARQREEDARPRAAAAVAIPAAGADGPARLEPGRSVAGVVALGGVAGAGDGHRAAEVVARLDEDPLGLAGDHVAALAAGLDLELRGAKVLDLHRRAGGLAVDR